MSGLSVSCVSYGWSVAPSWCRIVRNISRKKKRPIFYIFLGTCVDGAVLLSGDGGVRGGEGVLEVELD